MDYGTAQITLTNKVTGHQIGAAIEVNEPIEIFEIAPSLSNLIKTPFEVDKEPNETLYYFQNLWNFNICRQGDSWITRTGTAASRYHSNTSEYYQYSDFTFNLDANGNLNQTISIVQGYTGGNTLGGLNEECNVNLIDGSGNLYQSSKNSYISWSALDAQDIPIKSYAALVFRQNVSSSSGVPAVCTDPFTRCLLDDAEVPCSQLQ